MRCFHTMMNDLTRAAYGVVVSLAIIATASAVQAQSSVSDLKSALLGNISIPGLDSLPVSNVQSADGVASADVTLRGETFSVVVFTPDSSSQKVVALIPQSFSLADFVPIPSGSPVDNVTFEDMAFVVVPGNNAINGVDTGSLPDAVSTALSHSGASVNLKAGLNLFGRADFSGVDTISGLLSQIGITDVAFPLNGSLPTDLFSHDPKTAAASIKNQILDNLDINLPLPNLSIPGIPDAVQVQQTSLTVKAEKADDGSRSIDMAVRGELDIQIQGKTASFNFDVEIQKPSGKSAYIQFDAAEAEGETIELDLFHTVTLSNVKFDLNNSTGSWTWYLTGDSTLHGKPVSVAFNPGPPKYVSITTTMTLAEIVGEDSLPGLDDVEVDWVNIQKGKVEIAMQVKGVDSKVIMFKPSGATKSMIALLTGDFSPATFIPGAENTPLKDADFNGLSFLYNRNTEAIGINATNAPEVSDWLTAHTDVSNATAKPGLNVFGKLAVHPQGEMKSLLAEVGVTDLNIPLDGTLSPKSFSDNPTAIKNAILDNLDISIPLPAVSLSGVPAAVQVQQTNLTVKGLNNDGTRSIEVDLKGELDVTHDNTTAKFDFDIDVVNKSGTNRLKVTADEQPNSTLTVNMVETFALTNMSFEMDNFSNGAWSTNLSGDTSVKGNTIDFSYVKPAGKPYEIDITPTDLTLAKLIDSPGLPGLDDVTLDLVKIRNPGFWFLHGTFAGKEGYLYVQKNPNPGGGHYIAAYMYDLNLGSLIPGASNTPLNDVDFSNLVLFYNPSSGDVPWPDVHITGDAAPWIEQSNPNGVTLHAGMNVFGIVHVHPKGEMATLLSRVGISDFDFGLKGTIGKDLMHSSPGDSVKDAILGSLNLNVSIPSPSIPGLDDVIAFTDGKLHVTGTLPDGSAGVEVKVSGNASVPIASSSHAMAIDVRYDRPVGGGDKELFISGTSTKAWNKPFGMSWVDLKSLGITADKKTVDGTTDWDITVTAKTDIGAHSNLDVSIEVEKENGKLTGSEISLDGPVDLSEIPGIKDIPEVNSLTIKSISASTHGIDAKTTFHNAETDFFAFEASGDWIVAFAQKDFDISTLIPKLSSTPLNGLKLSEAAVVVAENGLNGTISSFGPIAQDAFETIYGQGADDMLSLAQGISLVTAFEHKESTGLVGDGLGRLGIKEEKIVLTGDIGGILGNSTPHVNLTANIDLSGNPTGMPNGSNVKKQEDLVFSVIATDTGGDYDVEIGIGVDVHMAVGSDELTFGGKMGLEFEAEKVDVKFVMKLETANLSGGKPADNGLVCSLASTPTFNPPPGPAGWHNPFGIPGFTLYDVIMDIAIDEDSAIHFGFAGGAKVGEDRLCVAADADVLPEDGGIPQDIAFIASVDTIKSTFLRDLVTQVATDILVQKGQKKTADDIDQLNKLDEMFDGLPQPEFKNVAFGFVTPGASDADLNITGEGVAMKGELFWLGTELGSMDVAMGPTTGFKFDSAIGNASKTLAVGPLSINNTTFDVSVPLPPSNPLNGYFKLNGDIDISALDVSEHISAEITNEEMSFTVSQTLSKNFSDSLTLALTGVDLSLPHPPLENADFAVSATLTADFGKFIETSMSTTLTTLFNDLDAFYATGLQTVTDDKAKVESLNTQIKTARAKARAEQKKIEAKVDEAQKKVNDLQNDIDSAWSKYHGCHWYNAAWCKPRWAITIAAEKVAKAVADAVLDAFESLVEHFPIDFDPTVWPLIVAKDAAVEALNVAKFAIEGLESIDGYLQDGVNAVGGSVNLKKATFAGDLGDIIDGKPVDLFIDVEFFGSEFSDSFAFTISDATDELSNLGTDAAKDLAHLSLLGYVGVYHMFDKVLSDIPSIFKRQLAHHLGEKLGAAQAAAKSDYEANKVDFANYGKTAQKLQETISTFSDTFSDSVLARPKPNPLDHEPASYTFTNEQIEIGRSGMCLGVGRWSGLEGIDACYPDGNSYQADQKISTQSVAWASGKDKGKASGYVKILKGDLCLWISGKWAFQEVDYGSSTESKMVYQNVFTPSTNTTSYGTPSWYTCGDTTEFHWKILEHGDGYYQFHNRATQTCMWMSITENSDGGISEILEMIPCAGARTQVFRHADTGVKAVLHTAGKPLVRAFTTAPPSNNPTEPIKSCVAATDSSYSGWLGMASCSKPYNANDFNSWNGYDSYDYFVDSLDRRRYKSKTQNSTCLTYAGYRYRMDGDQTSVFNAQPCDSGEVNQWLVTTPVIGGMAFQPDAIKTALTSASTLADPMTIYLQPQDPTAGATWKSISSGEADNSTWNVAYTAQDQAGPGIQARAAQWTSITTALAGKSKDLSEGKAACVEPGDQKLCYLLAPPTGYHPDPMDKTKLALPNLEEYKHYASVPASIIDDDVGMALKNTLPSVTPIAEPVWNICRGPVGLGTSGGSGIYYMPGVLKNGNSCLFPVGNHQHYTGVIGSQYLDKQTNLFWQPAGAGYMPATAVPTGRFSFDRTAKVFVGLFSEQWLNSYDKRPVFTCRAMVGRQTRIGWTAAGRYCHIINGTGGAVVEHFEVLTFDAGKSPSQGQTGSPTASGGMPMMDSGGMP